MKVTRARNLLSEI